MDIDHIRIFWQNEEVEFSGEVLMRVKQREVSSRNIEEVIIKGRIVEQRPGSKPYPKCTIRGWTNRKVGGLTLPEPQQLNVACGVGDVLYVITVYWEDEALRRGGESNAHGTKARKHLRGLWGAIEG
ncbi:MAG: DUF4258 domain-containing protein [bacterium]|nr:DUF4258 domain-containing protein [bacterium]